MMWAHDGGGFLPGVHPVARPTPPAAAAAAAVPEAATVHSQPRQSERGGVGVEVQPPNWSRIFQLNFFIF